MNSLVRKFVTVLVALAGMEAAVPPARPTEVVSRPFVDEYMATRSMQGGAKARIRFAERRLARDPDDLIGGWLLGAVAAGNRFPGKEPSLPDSSRISRILREAERFPDRPAGLLAAASILSARDEGDSSRALFRRAAQLYRERGRPDDAFHTLVLMTRLRPTPKNPETATLDVDLLLQESKLRGDVDSRSSALVVAGREAYRSDFERSLQLRQEALALLRTLSTRIETIECLNGIGNCFRRQGEFDRAQPFYEEALELARAMENQDQECAAIEGLALLEKNRGNLDRALDLFNTNLRLAEANGDLPSLTTSLFNARQVHRALGHPLEARNMAEKSLRLARDRNGAPETLAPALDAMATEELLIGRIEHGRELLEESVRVAERVGKPVDLVFPLLHLGNVYIDLGDLESAMLYTQRGLDVAKSSGHRRGQAHLRTQVAAIHLWSERFEEALALSRELWSDSTLAGDVGLPWLLSRSIAQSLAGLQRIDEAVAFLDSADVRLSNERPNRGERARNLSLKGDLLVVTNRPQDAVSVLEEALATFEELGDPLNTTTTSMRLGCALIDSDRNDEGVALLEQGIAWSERVRSGLTVGEERASYVDHFYNDYVDLARGYVRTGRTDEAFAQLERSRARELRRLYRSGGPGLPDRIRPELALDIAETEAQLAALQSTLLEQRVKPIAERSPSFPEMNARADSLERAREQMVRRVQREAPDYARELGLGPCVTADELAASLAPDEALLATMLGNRRSVVFWATAGGVQSKEIPWGSEEVRSRVGGLVEAMRGGEETWREKSAAFADTLLGAWPDGVARLVVVADGALNCLPFEALDVAASNGERRLLLERAEVVYTPSATLWVEDVAGTPQGASRPISFVAFGDPTLPGGNRPAGRSKLTVARAGDELQPLPHARREVLRIAARFPGSRTFVGDDATESRFFEESGHASVLHVAAHALVDDRRPSYSGLVLAASGQDSSGTGVDSGLDRSHSESDGFVQSFEVIRHFFPHDLVTLSACDTGRGKVLRGEGLLGLSRAFRLAGARSLVVSLWEVDDAATADFMDAFYASWAGGHSLAAALREAKLSFLRDGNSGETESAPDSTSTSRGVRRVTREERRSSPALWAPFVLLGSRGSGALQGAVGSSGR